LFSQRFRLGTFFGIGLYVHWTFSLLVLFVIYIAWASGSSVPMIGFSVVRLFVVFICVTLHEYGHALAARRYDVGTHDITLLPIGGIARLKRIPRIPWQEFVIAIAGPAVNVFIAILLVGLIVLTGGGWIFTPLFDVMAGTVPIEQVESTQAVIDRVFDSPTGLGFALSILMINLVLVIFNLIPAFPMDGGRVLRSILAMMLPYVEATRWAQRIGMFCAVLMAATAWTSDPPWIVMMLIAAFIVFAGLAEVRQVEIRDMVEGLTVSDVMTDQVPIVRADMNVDQLWQWWKNHPQQTAAVVGMNGVLLGQLRLSDLASYMHRTAAQNNPAGATKPRWEKLDRGDNNSPGQWNLTAIDLADPQAESLEADESLEALLAGGRNAQREYAVIDPTGRLVGWLNLDTLRERAALAKHFPAAPKTPAWSIDHHA